MLKDLQLKVRSYFLARTSSSGMRGEDSVAMVMVQINTDAYYTSMYIHVAVPGKNQTLFCCIIRLHYHV